ncbi:MAG TPA: hypothetical protein VE993_19275 [Stellaceae bacterium]|nr:hypothetical protein [Stellaceae bacterium]
MRFRRWPRVSAFEDTPRKRAALARSQEAQRERLPLLRELIAERQPGADEVMAQRAERWAKAQQEERDRRAQLWRQARAQLAGYGDDLRRRLITLWKDATYPADPAYLLDLLRAIDTGRIDLERPPWRFSKTLDPRVTPDPQSFDEAFRCIGRRRVGGGYKTIEHDEMTFVSNLGDGVIFLISRVRLINPNESFYTHANHRIRDSHVGQSGHWIDIAVHGSCSDDELELIRRLAQEADNRPVVVRRAAARTNTAHSDHHGRS